MDRNTGILVHTMNMHYARLFIKSNTNIPAVRINNHCHEK